MNVKVVQRRLWEQSREHKRGRETAGTLFKEDSWKMRIRNLYDLMHNPDWIEEACRRTLVRSRRKASGVDRETVWKFEKNRAYKLECLRLELKDGTYQPQPTRRVMIDKDDGRKRPLGIPCLRDKIVQEAMRMALEPIFEVEFHPDSYGFRPHRSAHHAISRCQSLIHQGFSWVIEGDVQACFDEIAHESIIRNLREKIMDNKFLHLVGKFLKAGVSVDGIVQPTEKGVPQGGVLSPLLANVVLNRLDWFLHQKGAYGHAKQEYARKYGKVNVRFVRYADDWCIFITRASKRYAAALRDQIRDFIMDTAGLKLSVEKTRITHIRDEINFLGFRMSKGVGRRGNMVPKVKIGKKAVRNIRRRLTEAIRFRPHQESITLRTERATRLIRGWREYYRMAHNFHKLSGSLDHYAFWEMVKAVSKKLDISSAKVLKRYYRHGRFVVGDGCKLELFSGAELKLYVRKPEEYVPGKEIYLDDYDDESTHSLIEVKQRRGGMDLRWEVMVRDSLCCRRCGKVVDYSTARIDHIIPVKRFASFHLAHQLDNLQTLCVECHKEKTNAERNS